MAVLLQTCPAHIPDFAHKWECVLAERQATPRHTATHETTPMFINGNVPPRRLPNATRRPREYLTAQEVEKLMTAAKSRAGRHGHRDATAILIAYRHGLRVSEL